MIFGGERYRDGHVYACLLDISHKHYGKKLSQLPEGYDVHDVLRYNLPSYYL